jgi:hypothetical protein
VSVIGNEYRIALICVLLTSLMLTVCLTTLLLTETGARVILTSIKESLGHGENEAPSPL